MPEQTLHGDTSTTIWVEEVTTTGTIDSVWAVITPPGFNPASGEPVTDLPAVTLTHVGNNRYEGTYDEFTGFGTYGISAYAMDTEGEMATPLESEVHQLNGSADTYEEDDTYSEANVIVLNDPEPQLHNFDIAGDEDWVMFYALENEIYEVKASNLGTNSDVVIELYDTDGITRIGDPVDDGGEEEDELLSWTCPADGIYYVKVSHYDPVVFGENTEYDLEVYRPAAFDLPGNVTGTVRDASSGAELGGVVVIVSSGSDISRANGYYTIWITVEQPSMPHSMTAAVSGYDPYADTVTVRQGDSTTENVNMIPIDSQPTANFTGTPTYGIKPLTVNFTNSSTGGDAPFSYQWDFDFNTGADSTSEDPTHIYNDAGTYDVQLTVTDTDGDPATLTQTNYISVCYPYANIFNNPTAYTSIQSAYNAAGGDATIESRYDGSFTEILDFDQDISVTLKSGYNCDHTSDTNTTTVTGNMTISAGIVTIDSGTFKIQ
jgi:PKD repeat protein